MEDLVSSTYYLIGQQMATRRFLDTMLRTEMDPRTLGRPRVYALCGPTGHGKTVFAERGRCNRSSLFFSDSFLNFSSGAHWRQPSRDQARIRRSCERCMGCERSWSLRRSRHRQFISLSDIPKPTDAFCRVLTSRNISSRIVDVAQSLYWTNSTRRRRKSGTRLLIFGRPVLLLRLAKELLTTLLGQSRSNNRPYSSGDAAGLSGSLPPTPQTPRFTDSPSTMHPQSTLEMSAPPSRNPWST